MFSKFLFRRQFILSSKEFCIFEGWNQIPLNNGMIVSAHPDLELTEAGNGEFRIILLGFLLDPFSPGLSNQEILNELINKIKSLDELIKSTEKYSGRWVLVYQDIHTTKLFHDPCAQRQVYYHFEDEHVTCASSTSLIHHFFPLVLDTGEELNQFLKSDAFLNRENDWIGDESIYLNVKHLMINFYLDFKKKAAIRFWPLEPLKKIGLSEGVILGAEIIKGTMLAANKRRRLALAVTSGMDTRILLAASKEIKESVSFYVGIYGSEKRYVDDFVVPDKLFKRLGLPFYAQRFTSQVPEEFKLLYKKNLTMARHHLPKCAFIYQQLVDFEDMLIINGNACEIAREMPFHRPYPFKKLSGYNLAEGYLGYPKQPYVIRHLDAWINEILPFCRKTKINIHDMLYWEQKMGNWGALYPAEQDIAVDQLTPFNNRLFLSSMLSVEVKYRVFPDYTVFRKMIEYLWPELLCEPINPRSAKSYMRAWIRHMMVRHFNNKTNSY